MFHTLVLRRSTHERRKLERYNPSYFCSTFTLYVIDENPVDF